MILLRCRDVAIFQEYANLTCPVSKEADRFCDCWTAAASWGIKDTYECEQDSDCQCKAGFYGNGKVCVPCKQCSAHATTSIEPKDNSTSCNLIGATSDWTTCTCNTGFYGDGFACDSCTTCDVHAVTYGLCSNGSVANQVTCVCNAGYYGFGTTCSPCPAGSYSITNGEPCP